MKEAILKYLDSSDMETFNIGLELIFKTDIGNFHYYTEYVYKCNNYKKYDRLYDTMISKGYNWLTNTAEDFNIVKNE